MGSKGLAELLIECAQQSLGTWSCHLTTRHWPAPMVLTHHFLLALNSFPSWLERLRALPGPQLLFLLFAPPELSLLSLALLPPFFLRLLRSPVVLSRLLRSPLVVLSRLLLLRFVLASSFCPKLGGFSLVCSSCLVSFSFSCSLFSSPSVSPSPSCSCSFFPSASSCSSLSFSCSSSSFSFFLRRTR